MLLRVWCIWYIHDFWCNMANWVSLGVPLIIYCPDSNWRIYRHLLKFALSLLPLSVIYLKKYWVKSIWKNAEGSNFTRRSSNKRYSSSKFKLLSLLSYYTLLFLFSTLFILGLLGLLKARRLIRPPFLHNIFITLSNDDKILHECWQLSKESNYVIRVLMTSSI